MPMYDLLSFFPLAVLAMPLQASHTANEGSQRISSNGQQSAATAATLCAILSEIYLSRKCAAHEQLLLSKRGHG